MEINHLVISGGYHLFTYILGSIHTLESKNILDISNIETIWCVSSGSFVALFISLLKGYRSKLSSDITENLLSWEVFEKYIEERPWGYLFINPSFSVYDILHKKGMCDEMVIHSMIEPLLKLLDLPTTITLKDFYEYTTIEIHFYSFDIYQFQMVDISYKTYPDMTLVNAIYVTASVPFLSIPHIEYNRCFIDGGFITNYPICYALKGIKNPENILGYNTHLITIEETDSDREVTSIKDGSIFYYIYFIFSILYKKIYKTFICRTENTHMEAVYQDIEYVECSDNHYENKYYNEINLEPLSNDVGTFYNGLIILFEDLYDFLYSNEKRRCMMEKGKEQINIIPKFFKYTIK